MNPTPTETLSTDTELLPTHFSTASGKHVTVAKHSGFCHGVEKAVNKTVTTFEQSEQPTYVLGQLIHNQQEIDRLTAMGITTVERLEDVPDGATCVIRTHGAPPETIRAAEARGIHVSDATCPDVRLVQNKAIELVKEGYTVVIVGKANHPEVIGIHAYAQEALGEGKRANVVAINTVAAIAESLKGLPRRKIGVVSQTTQLEENFFEMVKHLTMHCKELKVHNTICPATFFRQHAADELSKTVDVMVVVGGKNSSNTTHLKELCAINGTEAIHVETEAELVGWPPLATARHIGVTAGASTPEWTVQGVLRYLHAL